MGHIDDGRYESCIFSALRDLVDERLVNLEGVEGEFSQVVEAGEASAEVVEGNSDAFGTEILQNRGGCVGVFHEDGLGDFEFEISGINPCFREDVQDVFEKILILKLDS